MIKIQFKIKFKGEIVNWGKEIVEISRSVSTINCGCLEGFPVLPVVIK